MNEIILLKLGELVLKGLNRRTFEDRLVANARRRLQAHGKFKVYTKQSTMYVEPQSEDCDLDGAWEAMTKLFGVVGLSRARACAKDKDAMLQTAVEYLGDRLAAAKTFKVESKRADKNFPMTSIQLSQYVGGELDEKYPNLTVDVHHPELTVYLEVRDYAAYVHADPEPGAGGLPVGVGGRAVSLLSGGIDSPVASWMIAKRGIALEMVHFFSYPYTSEEAKQKVLTLAKLLTPWCGRLTVHVVPFTAIQEELRRKCPEELFTVLMRRFMMRIAEAVAQRCGAGAIVTGECLGQVASQTMEAMRATTAVTTLPILRPVVGMDKEEIVRIARRINTFETSILPYEDCCTVFTPRHPRLRPVLGEPYPYTSEEAKQKVLTLAKLLTPWCGRLTVHVVPFTAIQEELRRKCPEELFTVLMRRFMMRIAEAVAQRCGAGAIVTGECLGQVASQTMEAMRATTAVTTLPILRPVVGMDKEEIVRIARRINTFETSILPYEDCCTVFTPRHPRLRPVLGELEAAEAALDVEGLVKAAVDGIERVQV